MDVFPWVEVRKVGGEVLPRRVLLLDQTDLLVAVPLLELLLAGDGSSDIAVEFEIHQTENLVASREARDSAEAMLKDAVVQVAGDTDVEAARTAREDRWRRRVA